MQLNLLIMVVSFDTNFKIPVNVEKTTYYKLVDQGTHLQETGKSVTTQDYKRKWQ